MADEALELRRRRLKLKLRLRASQQAAPPKESLQARALRAEPGTAFEPDDPEQEEIRGPVKKNLDPQGFVGKAVRGTVQEIPTITGIAGGIAGTAAGGLTTFGVGAVPAGLVTAGVFNAAGASVRDIINDTFYPELAPQTLGERALSPAIGVVKGVRNELGGLMFGAFAKGSVGLTKALAGGFRDVAARVAAPVTKGVARAVAATHFPFAGKIASVLDDAAARANPKIIRKYAANTKKMANTTGSQLAQSYKKADKIMTQRGAKPPTTGEIRNELENKLLQPIREGQREAPASFFQKLKEQMDEIFHETPDTPNSLSKLWNKAKLLNQEAGKFSPRSPKPDASKEGILRAMEKAVRDRLEVMVGQTGDDVLIAAVNQQKKDFALFATGRQHWGTIAERAKTPETAQFAADRAAEMLAHGTKLGKFYKVLKGSVNRGLGAVASKHAFLLDTNEEYRELVERLDSDKQQGSTQPPGLPGTPLPGTPSRAGE